MTWTAATSSRSLRLSTEAEVLLTIFARRNEGLFILDGPASPEGADGQPDALDVYCVFNQDALPYALLTARNALSSLQDVEVRYHACRESDGATLNAICSRSRIFGERRRAAR